MAAIRDHVAQHRGGVAHRLQRVRQDRDVETPRSGNRRGRRRRRPGRPTGRARRRRRRWRPRARCRARRLPCRLAARRAARRRRKPMSRMRAPVGTRPAIAAEIAAQVHLSARRKPSTTRFIPGVSSRKASWAIRRLELDEADPPAPAALSARDDAARFAGRVEPVGRERNQREARLRAREGGGRASRRGRRRDRNNRWRG